jgi:4-amino-4-deoxy-L-arabinose transferase-like glycosyltransferase
LLKSPIMMTTTNLSRRAEVTLLILIFILALAPRLWCFFHNFLPEADAGNILEVGRNLAQGRGYVTYAKWDFYGEPGPVVHPEGNRQPLVPLVAAATFALGANTAAAARILTLIASLGALALLYVLIRRWLGPGLALAGVAVAALEPAFLWFSSRVQPEAYFALLFFAAVAVAGDFESERPSFVRAIIVGLLLSLSYLCRLNGALLLVAYLAALFVAYRRKAFAPAALALLAFAAAALPWWIRNARTFGDPLYSQAKYFIIAPNPEQVWAVKRYVPTWGGFFASYDFFGLLGRYVRGVWGALEPLLLGNLGTGEPFKGAPFAAFLLLAAVAVPLLRRRRALLFPALALLASILGFAVYGQDLFRYFTPFLLLAVPLGLAGVMRAAGLFEKRRRWITAALVVVLLLPLVKPLAKTLRQDDRVEYRRLADVATWLNEHTGPDEIVITWPRVIQLLYQYDRPTLYWPAGGIREILAVLTNYDVRFVVVEPVALPARPGLTALWYKGYTGLKKVPTDVSEDKLTIIRVDYGGDAFKQAYRAEDTTYLIVYEINQTKLRATVYGTYLTGIQ